MRKFTLKNKIIGLFLFVIIYLSTSNVIALDKFKKSDDISNYFTGVLLLNENSYDESFKYLKKLNGLENEHINYAVKYLYSLVNSGNFKEAFNYSRKLEKKKLDSFESHLITGVYHLKNSNLKLAKKYFHNAKNKNSRFFLNNFISDSLFNVTNFSNLNLDQASLNLKKLDNRFDNFKNIQNVFLNCFFDSSNTPNLFTKLTSNEKTDFSRYNYFFASYLVSKGKIMEAKEIINTSLKYHPRNLLLNQYKKDLSNEKNIDVFDCKKQKHIISEILYITSNALSSQSIYPLSNFYLNLAKYLNEDFHFYDTLLAENFYKIENYDKAKSIYHKLSKKGEALKWYASKQLAGIYILEKDKNKALDLLKDSYNSLIYKDIYEIFDYAEFLKNNEKFKESILYYSKIINVVDESHPLYAESTDGRGVSFERIGEWDKAEKDLLSSLKSNPEQAYVINYLAYSWIEQGVKISKSLRMLEKANKIKSNDPYIIDSLGWALFKLKRYDESKEYLQQAVKLMPADPIVNDHYGDVLWKNGDEIQARYYWKYVLNLKKTENELKEKIKRKLITGI
tara:strand:+ start:79 stop:1773 length:1695 start_codon:yes stop_codon:yes gene_type:complete